MKSRALLIGAALGAMILAATGVSAATYTTADGVLSMETPSESWQQLSDQNYWFAVSDGANTITVDHLSNGESLPSVQVADASYPAVYHAYVSTQNEVFVVKGLAKSSASLQTLMEAISTIKVLKYDTKTAIARQTAPAPASEFAIREMNGTYYVNTDELNVRSSYSTDSALVGELGYGDEVTVTGMVTKGGEDYGWFRIQFEGSTAYVSSAFLSSSKQSGTNPTSAPAKEEDDPFSKYDSTSIYSENGTSKTIYYVPSSGLWMDRDGIIFSPMAEAMFYEAGSNTYWSEDVGYWDSHSSSEFNYDEYAESISEIGDNDTIESSFTVYSEGGNFKEIFHYMPSDVYQDRHGVTLQPMAGALFYEPSTDSYWDADPDFWNENSSSTIGEAFGENPDYEYDYIEDEEY